MKDGDFDVRFSHVDDPEHESIYCEITKRDNFRGIGMVLADYIKKDDNAIIKVDQIILEYFMQPKKEQLKEL